MLHLCGQKECRRLEKKYGLLIGKLAGPIFPSTPGYMMYCDCFPKTIILKDVRVAKS